MVVVIIAFLYLKMGVSGAVGVVIGILVIVPLQGQYSVRSSDSLHRLPYFTIDFKGFFCSKKNLTTSLNNNPRAVPDGQGHVGQQQADLRGAGRPALQVDGDDAGHEDRQAGMPRTDQAREDRRGAPGGAQVPQEGLFLLVSKR